MRGISLSNLEECNYVLTNYERDCECYDSKNNPSKDPNCSVRKNKNNRNNLSKKKKCKTYNKCKSKFRKFMSHTEPEFNPPLWKDPLVEKSHNCYIYALDDRRDIIKKDCLNICKKNYNSKLCRSNKSKLYGCSQLKPQPGHHSGNWNDRRYSCPAMKEKIMADSKSIKYGVPFTKKCPKNYYKAGLTVQTPEKGSPTYHFYRQDRSGRWSHKQGTLPIEYVDASGKTLWAPHLANRNYDYNNDGSGINYNKWCNYFCVPRNYWKDTWAI